MLIYFIVLKKGEKKEKKGESMILTKINLKNILFILYNDRV